MPEKLIFEKIREETKNIGLNLEDFAKELLQELSKTNIPLPVQKLLIQVIMEIHNTNQWMIDEFLTIEQLNRFKNTFLNHDHLNHEVVIRAKSE